MRTVSALRLLSVLSFGAVMLACSSEPSLSAVAADAGPTDPSNTGTVIVGGEEADGGAVNVQEGACTKIDFLFVVDNSGSMDEEQQNLGTNFPRFVQAIEAFRNKTGQALDYRIAVTTTGITNTRTITGPFPGLIPPLSETGQDGAMQQKCGMSRRWLQKGDANLPSTFACVAKVGTNGPSFEMPLEATKRALVDRVQDGTNAGFLRDDALLAVVMLTDENDCSVPSAPQPFEESGGSCDTLPIIGPIPSYLQALDTAKGGGTAGRSRWASAVIAGPNECSSSFGSADKATRLLEFVRQAGSNAVFSSICSGDLAGALTQALGTFQAACNNFQPPR